MTYYIDTETFDFRIFDILNFKEKAILYLASIGYKGQEIAKILDTSYIKYKQRTYDMKKKIRRIK